MKQQKLAKTGYLVISVVFYISGVVYMLMPDVPPPIICGLETLTKDRAALDRFYQKGYHDGSAIQNFVCTEE